MFHTSHIHVPRGTRRQSALRTFIASSSFGPQDSKDPLRRGILMTAVAFVLLLIGSILTWLGFNELLGGRMSMTGPLLIMLSFLLMLLSVRQFLLARKRNTNSHSSLQLNSVNGETVTAVVVNQDDGLQPATIIVDRYNRLGYDPTVGLLRRRQSIDNDYAPPSYHEVTRQSSSTNATTHEGLDELPPTYEETMGSFFYSSSHVGSTSALERPSLFTSCVHPATALSTVMRRTEGDRTAARSSEGDSAVAAIGGPPHYSRLQKPMPLPRLHLEVVPRVQCEMSAPTVHVQCAVTPSQQNKLTLPPLHMSAPTTPRQLSAPSPHPFSAPPSPRQLSPHQMSSVPLQFPGSACSGDLLSSPSLQKLMPAPPVFPNSFQNSSPHTFSAPSSPRPFAGQHNLTPPPQYFSTPPSPRQLSAPPSPLACHQARSPCYGQPTFASAMPQVSTQLPLHQYSAGAEAARDHEQVALQSHFYSFTETSPRVCMPIQSQLQNLPPKVNSSQEGYTCFTYNFVTPFPLEVPTSSVVSAPFTYSYPPSQPNQELCASASQVTDSLAVGRSSNCTLTIPSVGMPGSAADGKGLCIRTPQPCLNSMLGEANASVDISTFTRRTDIQANI